MKVLVLLALAGAACGAALPQGETPEVSAAKERHSAAFEAAAARAEAAPDFDLDGRISAYSGFLSALDGRLSPLYTDTLPYGAYGVHAPVVGVAPVSGGAVVAAGLPGPYFFPGAYSLLPRADCPYCP